MEIPEEMLIPGELVATADGKQEIVIAKTAEAGKEAATEEEEEKEEEEKKEEEEEEVEEEEEEEEGGGDPCSSAAWLSGEATVHFDQQPPLLDESRRQRMHALPDGSHEVLFECEICQKMMVTAAQLSGQTTALFSHAVCSIWVQKGPFKYGYYTRYLLLQ